MVGKKKWEEKGGNEKEAPPTFKLLDEIFTHFITKIQSFHYHAVQLNLRYIRI